MIKNNNSGYMLAETLIVTAFVAGVLIYLFVQLSNLSNNYELSHNYNTVPDLYALIDVVYYIEKDTTYVPPSGDIYIDLTNCSSFTNPLECKNLLTNENIVRLLVAPNDISAINFDLLDDPKFEEFISKITPSGIEEYRLIAKFKDDTFATLRFGG